MKKLALVITLLTTLALAALAAAADATSVPIVVDAYLPDGRPQAPVTFGVPFARGQLQDASGVRVVDERGEVVPHQQAVTAKWDAQGKDGVRWLLVDMLVDGGKKYTLQFGKSADAKPQAAPGSAPAPGNNLAVVEGEVIRINTGLYGGTVRMKGFDLFADLQFRGEPVAQKGEGVFSAFYVEHEKRGVFRSDLDSDATVVLEETGPVRATLKANGWYANAKGEKFCRYSIRMHFFKGRPEVKLEHTFIFTGLSKEDKIAAVGMKVQRQDPAKKGGVRTYVGNEDLLSAEAVSPANHVIQIASERDRLDFYTPGEGKQIMKIAERGGGWMCGEGAGGFSVAIRDAWQQYPWAIKYDTGTLDLQLWPREAGLLDLTWDGYWTALTDRQKVFLADHMERSATQPVEQWMDRLRASANATGAAKTHEVWFAAQSDARIAREAAYPTLAHADTAWMCQTQALDLVPHVSAGAGMFEDEETVLRQMLSMMQAAVASNHWYGWWDWGGYHTKVDPEGLSLPRFGLWADDAGMGRWHRARPKSHYQWGRFPWMEYMRSGERDWLRYAQTYTLYSADRAHCHYTGNGRADGAEYHYDNSVVPWMGGYRRSPGGDQTWVPLQGKDDYVYAYWLTGSRHALDVLQANGELVLASADPIGFKPGFEQGNDIRNAGMMLERAMILYQATWDERYLVLAKKIAALFLPLDTPEKVQKAEWWDSGYFHQASTWAYQGMWFYDRVVGDPAFRKVLQLFIDRARDVDAGFVYSIPGENGSPRALTYGYLLTGDTTYLDLARPGWDDFVGRGVTPDQFTPGGKQELSGMPALLGAMATAPQKWRDANLPMRQRGAVLTWRCFQRGSDTFQPATRAFIREAKDGVWSFIVASNGGGTFAVYRPDGAVASTVTLDAPKRNWVKIDVPADGQSGDYAVVCTAIDEKLEVRKDRYARIVGCPLPVTVQIVPGRDVGVSGRAYCIMADPAANPGEKVSLTVSPLDRQRWITLLGASGSQLATTQGSVPLMNDSVNVSAPVAARGQVLTMEFSLDRQAYYKYFERARVWTFEGVLPFLAGTPQDYFVPKISERLPALGK